MDAVGKGLHWERLRMKGEEVKGKDEKKRDRKANEKEGRKRTEIKGKEGK